MKHDIFHVLLLKPIEEHLQNLLKCILIKGKKNDLLILLLINVFVKESV